MSRIKTVTITDEEFYVKESIYVNMFKCPDCGSKELTEESRYCNWCGCRIEWKLKPI